jgi:hypothetical protein
LAIFILFSLVLDVIMIRRFMPTTQAHCRSQTRKTQPRLSLDSGRLTEMLTIKNRLRNIHAGLGRILACRPHGYCASDFRIKQMVI